ncbi:MAG: type II toxin-antitoxin system RnlB family antitoxin [Lentilactobacillus hilgardii]|uniref:type II toxin-antitoxin system RnlB family antitoxin n=1 Tax=Lentilactobacillus hilgardii TaxID=1588 RepID=UPI0039EA7BF1
MKKNNETVAQLKIKSGKYDYIFVSFSNDAPYYAIKNNIEFDKKFNGKILVDTGFRTGNKENRFRSFDVTMGELDRESAKVVKVPQEDMIRKSSNKLLATRIKNTYSTGFNETQVQLLKSGVSI